MLKSLLAATATALALAALLAPPPSAPPGILLVTLDTARADHCSAYGYARPTTPRLDRVAREGVRFEAAYAPMATTGPAHATLFTALLPRAHGMLKNGQVLVDEHRTLAEILGERGYRTAAFLSSFAVDRRFGLAQGFADYDDDFTGARSSITIGVWEGVPAPAYFDRRADQTVDRAIAWLRAEGYLERTRRRAVPPLFLWVHLFDPHAPYDPPAEHAFPAPDGATEVEREIAAYDGEMRFADAEMGRLLDALVAAGTLDELVVVVAGDHGEGLGQHDHMNHGVLIYEEAVRVPLVLRWPRRLPAGRVVAAPVGLLDVAPTLLAWAGVDMRVPPFARSLAPLAEGAEDGDPERPIYLQRRHYEPGPYRDFELRGDKHAVRQGRWKYIEAREEGTYELYDLRDDPGELVNRYAERQRKAAVLRDLLHRWLQTPAAAPAGPVSPEDAERLRALGYVQ